MDVKKKIISISLGVILLSIAITGCISSNVENQYSNISNLPVFTLKSFTSGGLTEDPRNYSYFSFSMYIINPNNERIELQFLYFNIIDELGNIVYSFKPTPNPELEIQQFNNEKFTLYPNENITLYNSGKINNNIFEEYYWSYMYSQGYFNYSISGLYNLNNELTWFESNLCEVGIIT